MNPPPILGSEKFILWIKDRFFKEKTDKEVPAARDFAPHLDTIICQVSRDYAVRPDALTSVHRGMENEPCDVPVYLARSMRSEPLMSIGAGFGLNRYSSVNSTVTRVKSRLEKGRRFRQRIDHIERNILKGQTKT